MLVPWEAVFADGHFCWSRVLVIQLNGLWFVNCISQILNKKKKIRYQILDSLSHTHFFSLPVFLSTIYYFSFLFSWKGKQVWKKELLKNQGSAILCFPVISNYCFPYVPICGFTHLAMATLYQWLLHSGEVYLNSSPNNFELDSIYHGNLNPQSHPGHKRINNAAFWELSLSGLLSIMNGNSSNKSILFSVAVFSQVSVYVCFSFNIDLQRNHPGLMWWR